MRLLKILLIVILIISPFPIGYFLIERTFLTAASPHLFHGDIPKNEIPEDYYSSNQGFFFEIPDGPFKGKKMFYQDMVYGGSDPISNTILFVHGNLSSSYIYNDVISQLKKKTPFPIRIIAMDLIGFGLSDRASSRITPTDHAETILKLVTHLGLSNIILVAHGWGGPFGIHALLHIPETVKGLVLINSTVFQLTSADRLFSSYKRPFFGCSRLTGLVPDLLWGKYAVYSIFRPPALSFLGKIDFMKNLIMGNHPKTGGPNTKEVQFYENHLRTAENVQNSRTLFEYADYFRGAHEGSSSEKGEAMPEFIGFIDQNLHEKWGTGGLDICVAALFGDQDTLSDPVIIDKWKKTLPQSDGHIQIIKDAGHFLQKEHPDPVAEAIIDVLSRIKRAAPPVEEIPPTPENPILEMDENELIEN